MFIDRATDDVYISDSSRHLVRKYTRDGVEAAEPARGFKFPNQLMLHERYLLIADTNHHRIRVVRPESERFGVEYYNADVVPREAKANDQSWPSHFVRVGDKWWVNVMKTGMNYGGIYVFDAEWRFEREIPLPGKADPISLIGFNGEVLVSDWYGNRVHRISTDGEVLGDFQSQGLIEVLAESATQRRMFILYAWLAVAIGLVLVAMIVIKGTDWAPSKTPPDDRPPAPPEESILLEPNPENVEKLRSNIRMGRWLGVPLVIVVLYMMFLSDDVRMVVNLAFAGIGFFAVYLLVAWMTRVNTSTSIRFDGDRVTLRNHAGHQVRCPVSRVFFSDSVVTSDDIAIFLGQGNMPIYDRDAVLAELERRLPPSQRISPWAMQKKLIAMRHPIGWIAFITLAVLAVMALLLLR